MSRFFWPNGLIPPRTYPVTRSATTGSHISTRFAPSALPTAFSDNMLLTGTIATACLPSAVTSNVLNT